MVVFLYCINTGVMIKNCNVLDNNMISFYKGKGCD